MIRRLSIALFLLLPLGAPTSIRAQPAAQPAASPPAAAANPADISPAEAKRIIDVLQDPKQRAQLIETLQAIAKALPPPAQKPPAAPEAKPAAVVKLAPHSLGAQLLGGLTRAADALAGEAATAARTITDFPVLWYWADRIAGDPEQRQAVLDSLWRAALVVGCAMLLEWLARLAAVRPIAILAQHAPAGSSPEAPSETVPGESSREAEPAQENGAWPLLRRLPFALARFVLELVPIGVFWGAGSLLAALAGAPLTRQAILIVVGAYAATRLIISIGRMLASSDFASLRLLQIDDEQAAYLIRWLRRVTIVAVFGSAAIDLAELLGLSESAAEALTRLVALVVAILATIVVLRSRHAVAQRLRADPAATGGLARSRNGFAAIWHYLALIAIVAAWIVWAAGVQNGLGGLWVLLGSVAIIVGARLVAIVALGTLDRTFRLTVTPASATGEGASRAARYQPAARAIAGALIGAATVIALLQFWGVDTLAWFYPGSIGSRLASALLTIAIAGIAAIVVWESANARLEHRLARLSAAGSAGHAARLRTLLPILRAALLVAVLSVVGLTALSEIGIDIAPLLAGAGIVGVAVGFGSQKLVQDVITGMFVLFENAIQIGDTVTVAGLTGTVEQLSVRNIWLRGGDGSVYIVPFSAVTSITNSNRGLGNAAVAVTVAFDEDSDRVAKALQDIAGEMRTDPAFAPLMLGDLTVWVDAVKAWGVIFAGQIVCTDAGRWAVQREFNRRLQMRFRELGIALSDWHPVPAMTAAAAPKAD